MNEDPEAPRMVVASNVPLHVEDRLSHSSHLWVAASLCVVSVLQQLDFSLVLSELDLRGSLCLLALLWGDQGRESCLLRAE